MDGGLEEFILMPRAAKRAVYKSHFGATPAKAESQEAAGDARHAGTKRSGGSGGGGSKKRQRRQARRPRTRERDEAGQELYCLCRKAYDEDAAPEMIMCDFCGDWYHFRCIGLKAKELKSIKKYKCALCREWERQEHLRRQSEVRTALARAVAEKRAKAAAAARSRSSAPQPAASSAAAARAGSLAAAGEGERRRCGLEECAAWARPGSKFCRDSCGTEAVRRTLMARYQRFRSVEGRLRREAVAAVRLAVARRLPATTSPTQANPAKQQQQHQHQHQHQQRQQRQQRQQEEVKVEAKEEKEVEKEANDRDGKEEKEQSEKEAEEERAVRRREAAAGAFQPSSLDLRELALYLAELDGLEGRMAEAEAQVRRIEGECTALEALIARAQAVEGEEVAHGGSKEALSSDCVSCGHPVSLRSYSRHLEQCFAKREAKEDFMMQRVAIDEAQATSMCNHFDLKTRRYCHRFMATCPLHQEHTKRVVVKSGQLCAYPSLNEDGEEEYCMVGKSKCQLHFAWEKLRRADLRQQMQGQLMLRSYLFHEARELSAAITRRAERAGFLVSLLLED